MRGWGARPGRPWSDEDKALLAELFPRFSNRRIAAYLGRTVGSIIARAHVQGLRKPPGWAYAERKRRLARNHYGPLIRREAPSVGSSDDRLAG